MDLFVGCDLGGTNIKAGLVDISAGQVLLSRSTPTLAQEGPEAVMGRIADLIRKVIAENGASMEDIQGVGVSAPGLLDLEKGIVLFLTNLHGHWPNVPLQSHLSSELDLPVAILNDARAITLGEYTFGAGRGATNMACLAIGTGIGGGVIVDGQLVLGLRGQAGELGHLTIDLNGPRCGCGNKGCMEAFAAAPAIATMGVKVVQRGQATLIGELVDYDLNKITPEVIAEAARKGDEIAREIWKDTGSYIGTGIANLIVTLAPERIVISGGVAAAGDLLLDPIRRTIKERVFLIPVEEIQILTGELGNDAGVLGMAQWAQLQLQAASRG
jgi:glucokinase